ncbi:Uncharacterized membrane-anchored protein YitT, contains DUF161 and DUF2179 domains [Melghirimyces thermohalophilus]|uniref:Uncharacterized membrane-anchored protein YitT, contains DUF161 and DUF2179 domains n=2 Tax=Melghirimyces thermohalophilus TaxID=1236220 RepID=A0A1G6P1N5_9BACL|nr:Uncharacterized membrane-anchored protein YitT, contains DUF161 and DUF2179 domains [Melghirimyces thermohalophilus]
MVYRLMNLGTIIISSLLIGFAFNMFLLPQKILSGGVSGIAMILGLLTPFNTGTFILLLNIPIIILGYLRLGKQFIFYTLISVAVTSISMQVIPERGISDDPILSSVFGGVIVGAAMGFIFRSGASTGGFDVISMVLSQKREMPLGLLISFMNAIVVFISGFVFDWELALYTMLSIFVTGKLVDTVHTRHIKLTLMIITKRGNEIKKNLLANLVRGITVLDGEGAFTSERRNVLITVISRYELTNVKRIIRESDPHAFVNITQTTDVMGYFRKD